MLYRSTFLRQFLILTDATATEPSIGPSTETVLSHCILAEFPVGHSQNGMLTVHWRSLEAWLYSLVALTRCFVVGQKSCLICAFILRWRLFCLAALCVCPRHSGGMSGALSVSPQLTLLPSCLPACLPVLLAHRNPQELARSLTGRVWYVWHFQSRPGRVEFLCVCPHCEVNASERASELARQPAD